jgi:hypothetical protein
MADYGELSYLLGQRRRAAGGMAGAGSEIGAALAGGDTLHRQEIYNKSAYEGARMADVLAQARQRQQQEIGRQNYAEELRRGGENDLASVVLASGNFNPNEIASYRENAAKTKALQDALKIAESTSGPIDYNRLNAIKMASSATPTEIVRALGEGQYTTNAYRTDPTVVTSDIGKALIGERGARAASAMAEADAHRAQAERARAGIGADKAANYEVIDTPQGRLRVNKLTGETSALTLGGQPVTTRTESKPFTEADVKAGGLDDPEKFLEFQKRKAKNPAASDRDVYVGMKQDEADEAELQKNLDLANQDVHPSPSIGSMFGKALQSVINPIGAAVAGAPKSANVAGSPHPEGTKLRGKDGKMYIVQNGQPVPLP